MVFPVTVFNGLVGSHEKTVETVRLINRACWGTQLKQGVNETEGNGKLKLIKHSQCRSYLTKYIPLTGSRSI